MIFEDEEAVIKFIKKHQTVKPWVAEARKKRKTLDALVTGKDFKSLINRIEGIEPSVRQVAREKYSKDIRDLFVRLNQPRENVFTAPGGTVVNEISSKEQSKKMEESLAHFKGQKSIRKYLAEDLFSLGDVDPNGLIFLEYKGDIDIYPTYKSINDIRYYKSNGQLCEVVMFEPKSIKVGSTQVMEFRVVDDLTDWRFLKFGDEYQLREQFTFEHPFGQVPAVILSERIETGTEIRLSNINDIEQQAEDYARDKSVLTIYKFQNGFPINWRFKQKCTKCNGVGKIGKDICGACNGKGDPIRNDVTDIRVIDVPREGDPQITPNIGGFIAPDLKTWERYKEDLKDAEESIEGTLWGTAKVANGKNETATGRWLDVQPVMNKLSYYTSQAEWTENTLINWVENWVNGTKKEKSEFYTTYGNRYILESQDVLLDKYSEAREKGENATVLDKLLDEYLLAKNQNNPKNAEISFKKRQVEPYIHLAITDVNSIFGSDEARKVVAFVNFWEQANHDKTVEALKKEFDEYFNNLTSTTE